MGVDRAAGLLPCVVAAGDDLDAAVEHAIAACFERTADAAAPTEQLLVHAEVHDAFVAKLTARSARVQPRALADEPALRHVVDLVDDAWTRGAAITQHHPHSGLHYPPTILTGVTTDMQIATTPTYGPLAPIVKVARPPQAAELAREQARRARAALAGWSLVAAGDDLDAAVEHAIAACFRRTADAALRILVHAAVHDAFVAELTARSARLQPQALADQATLQHVVDLVDDAWTRGAAITQHHPHSGLHYPPTILTGVTTDMQIATTPTCGPLAPVLRIEGA